MELSDIELPFISQDALTKQIETHLIHTLTAHPLTDRQVDAAIVMVNGSYYYQRRISSTPPRYAYRCLSPEQLAIAFANGNLDSGWLPSGVVRYGRSVKGNWGVYYSAAKKHQLIIDNAIYHVPLPPIVWIGFNSTYWVVAIKGSFSPNAIAYHVPLPNVYDTGKMCWGTNNPPSLQTHAADSLVRSWKLFMKSPFNDHLVAHKSRRYSTNVSRMLIEVARSSANKYPLNDLLPFASSTFKIEDLLQRILQC